MTRVPAQHLQLAAAAVVSCLALASLAYAATPIKVTAAPSTVSPGQRVTLRGSGWGVIEFCTPRVTLTLTRPTPLKPLPIATVKLRTGANDSGTFSTSWTVPASVHSGTRTIVATQTVIAAATQLAAGPRDGASGTVQWTTRGGALAPALAGMRWYCTT